jgi:hypothetical protein
LEAIHYVWIFDYQFAMPSRLNASRNDGNTIISPPKIFQGWLTG